MSSYAAPISEMKFVMKDLAGLEDPDPMVVAASNTQMRQARKPPKGRHSYVNAVLAEGSMSVRVRSCPGEASNQRLQARWKML